MRAGPFGGRLFFLPTKVSCAGSSPGGFRGPGVADDACEQPAGAGGSPPQGNCVAGPLSIYWEVPPPSPPVCSDGLDNDGDALIDEEDPGCVDEFDGSELPVSVSRPLVRHARTINLRFAHRTGDEGLVVYGRLRLAEQDDDFRECIVGQPVTIQRRVGGRWKPQASATTDGRGRYEVSLTDRRGRHRAVATRAEVLADGEIVHVCRRTMRAKPHRHRR